ncbi:MAG: hypothetical protein GX776_08600 [Oxalobacter sp.]|nr:hypothetical protein [Oxalobacter sp.]
MNTHLTTQEDITIFKHILDLCIRPVIGSARLSGPFTDAEKASVPAVFLDEKTVKIFMPNGGRIYFLMQKGSAFNLSDKTMLTRFVSRLQSTVYGSDALSAYRETSGVPVQAE